MKPDETLKQETIEPVEIPKQETVKPVETPKKETVLCETCNTETTVGVPHDPSECNKVLVRDHQTYKDKSQLIAFRVCIAFAIGACLLMLTMWKLSASWKDKLELS